MELGIRDLSIVLSFASIVLVLSVIPAFPVIGFNGMITLGALAGTIIGIFLNPIHGLIVVIMSSTFLPLINPGIIGILGYFYFLPLLLSWIVSLTFTRKGPMLSLIILMIGLLGFVLVHIYFIDEYIEYLYYDGVLPLIYVVIYYLLRNRIPHLRELGAIVYGVIGDHIGGNIGSSIMYLYIFELINKIQSDIRMYNAWVNSWKYVAYIYPFERTIIILIGAIVVLPVLRPWRRFCQSQQ